MTESAVGEVLGSQVEIRARGDDHCVLATGFSGDSKIRLEGAEKLCCLKSTGEDHLVNLWVGNQFTPEFRL